MSKPPISTDDTEIRRLAAAGRTRREIGKALGRSEHSIRSYCWTHKIEVKPAPQPKRASAGASDVLALLSGQARKGEPCSRNADMAGYLGIGMATMHKALTELRQAGHIRIERRKNQTRRIHVAGIGWTGWSLRGNPGAAAPKAAPARLKCPEEVFAGVRFDEAPVPRDPRRFNRPATRVLTGVTGAWA